MKKTLLSIFVAVATMLAVSSCSSDDDKVPGQDLENKTYAGETLTVTNDGRTVLSQTVSFTPEGNGNAKITIAGATIPLDDIIGNIPLSRESIQPVFGIPAASMIPGSPMVSFTAELAGTPDNCTFSGTSETEYCTFNYSGSVDAEKMTLDITNVTLKNTSMAGTYKMPAWEDNFFKTCRVNWIADKKLIMPFLGEQTMSTAVALALAFTPVNLGSASVTAPEALATVLKDVTFGTDGSITATYLDTKNESLPQVEAPKGFASYVVKDDHTLLVFLDIQQIIASTEAAAAQSKSRALDVNTLLESLFTDVFPLLSNGIPVHYGPQIVDQEGTVDNDNPSVVSFYLGTETLLPLLKIAAPIISDETVVDAIVEAAAKDPGMGMMAAMLPDMLKQLPDIINATTTVELGINLTRQ